MEYFWNLLVVHISVLLFVQTFRRPSGRDRNGTTRATIAATTRDGIKREFRRPTNSSTHIPNHTQPFPDVTEVNSIGHNTTIPNHRPTNHLTNSNPHVNSIGTSPVRPPPRGQGGGVIPNSTSYPTGIPNHLPANHIQRPLSKDPFARNNTLPTTFKHPSSGKSQPSSDGKSSDE